MERQNNVVLIVNFEMGLNLKENVIFFVVHKLRVQEFTILQWCIQLPSFWFGVRLKVTLLQ